MGIFASIRNSVVKLAGGMTSDEWNARVGDAWVRSYNEVAQLGGVNSDWGLNAQSQDSDVWQNNFALRQRSRDLFDTDPIRRKYVDQLDANVFGEHGHTLRMKVKEEADRIVYVDEEKAAIERHLERMQTVVSWAAAKSGVSVSKEFIRLKFGEFTRSSDPHTRAKGTVLAGALDIFANQLIERKWAEWKRAQYCTVTGKLSYRETCRIRLESAARDGGFFIRHVRDPRVNKFGYAIQLINDEWCDYNYNCPDSSQLPTENVPDDVIAARVAAREKGEKCSVRMGVEINEWGKPIAYHFIKRQPQDWQFAPPGGYFLQAGKDYTVISAREIIHYARFDYADSTRPAGWGVSTIPLARQRSQYTQAATVAARGGACQSGFFYSDIVPEGGTIDPDKLPNPCKLAKEWAMMPGVIKGLPYGIKFQPNNPNNPNSQFGAFRKEVVREEAAGLPAANYNMLANDSEGISYSTGRIFSLDEREQWKLIQRWDIDRAELPIFEAWLEMALTTGAIPLPLKRFEKFNHPVFTGRRWDWVDPAKDAMALETELKNFITSWSRIFANRGEDLEEVWIERAEEMMMAEKLGIKLPTWETAPAAEPKEDEDPEEDEPPVNGKKNGRHITLQV